jgi:hypothetical protein
MKELPDIRRPEFWDVRHAAHETPWDFYGVPAALKAFLKPSQARTVYLSPQEAV